MTRIAIIGTAGRKDDAPRLTADVWEQMLSDARAQIDRLAEGGDRDQLTLVSGGAAWADHLAVKLWQEGKAGALELHLPARLGERGFAEDPAKGRMDAGRVANYYHGRFRQTTGVDGLADLREARDKGARIVVTEGFKERNTKVAESADAVLAYTFGGGREVSISAPGQPEHRDAKAAGLKDGGTADTWWKAAKAATKIHVPIDLVEERVRAAGGRVADAPSAGGQQTPVLQASMYFNYGRNRREDVASASTFDAILAGERTSTTRFDAWQGTDRWRRLQPGQKVRFFDDKERKGRAVDVTVKEVREVDLANMDAEQIEAWSKAEGWTPQAGRDFGAKHGRGVQILYGDPQPVRGRDRGGPGGGERGGGPRGGGSGPRQQEMDLGDDRRAAPRAGNTDRFKAGGAGGPAYGAPDAIRGFQGKHRWMSNFAPVDVVLDGETYPTVEHAYQAAKTLIPEERARIRGLQYPGQAKKAGREVTVRGDWDAVKDRVMAELQDQKYATPEYRAKLLATGNREIYEENGWGDRYWGVDAQGRGENRMGKLLMAERAAWRAREAGDFVELPGEEIAVNLAEDDYLAGPGERVDYGDAPAYPGPAAVATPAETARETAGSDERSEAPATTFPAETATAAPAAADTVETETVKMAETENQGASAPADPRTDKERLEAIAEQAVVLDASFRDNALAREFAADTKLAAAHQGFADLRATLEDSRLVATDARPRAQAPKSVRSKALEDVADQTMIVVEEISEPGVAGRIAAAGGGATIRAARDAELALAAFDYTTPESEEVSHVVEQIETGQETRRVQRGQIEAIVGQSLDFLEKTHDAGADFSATPAANEHAALTKALDDAGYLLPGENEQRAEPLSEQSHRGDERQLLGIADAAHAFAGKLDAEAIDGIGYGNIAGAFTLLARSHVADQANALKGALQAAGYDQEAVDKSGMLQPVMVEDEKDYGFMYVRTDEAPELEGVTGQEKGRDILLQSRDDDELFAVLRREPVSARTDAEAVERFRTAMGADRDKAIVLGTGREDFSLDRFDDIEQAFVEGRDPEAPTPSNFRGRSAFSDKQANALADLFQAAESIANAAQVDSGDPTRRDDARVTFPDPLYKTLVQAHTDASNTQALDVLKSVADGKAKAPGLDTDSAGMAYGAAKKMDELISLPQKREGEWTLHQEVMDRYLNASDQALTSGAVMAIGALAGREDLGRDSMSEGRALGGFASQQEALAAGKTPPPDKMAGNLSKARPEMSYAYYRSLSEDQKKASRAFVMKPGEGFFKGYFSAQGADGKVPIWRQRRLRGFIREQMNHPDGAPNHKFRAALSQLALDDAQRNQMTTAWSAETGKTVKKGGQRLTGRAIVAPTVDEARVIREEADRLNELHRADVARQGQAWTDKAPKAEVAFDAETLAKFARKAEASGSDRFATLVKRGERLSLEHPEAPTARSEPVAAEYLQEMRDGYRLAKVDPKMVAAAMEAHPEQTRMALRMEADRVAGVAPVESTGKTLDPAVVQKRRRAEEVGMDR